MWQLFLVCVDIKKISTNKHKGKGFRKSTEGRAIWSPSVEGEIRSLAV